MSEDLQDKKEPILDSSLGKALGKITIANTTDCILQVRVNISLSLIHI